MLLRGVTSHALRTAGRCGTLRTCAAAPWRLGGARALSGMRRDPDAATSLHYHPLEAQTWALSLLATPPPSAAHVTVLGVLRTDGSEPEAYLRTNPDAVRAHPPFWDALHHVLRSLAPGDEALQTEAYIRQDGWAHLCDARATAMPGRVPSPDDIFASIAFQHGKLDATTYEPNAMYRFCVRPEGPMQLPPAWLDAVRARFASLS